MTPIQIVTWATAISNGEATLMEPSVTCGFETRHASKVRQQREMQDSQGPLSLPATLGSTDLLGNLILSALGNVTKYRYI
jgi:hypothetical protein